MRTRVVVWITGILTIILLAASFAFLFYQWYLINGLSITIFLFPITIVKVNPLGVIFYEQPLYVTNITTKLILDLLFLIPYTLAILVTGPICLFVSPFSGIAGHEKFSDAANKVRLMITKGTRKQRALIISGILAILVSYLVLVFFLFESSTSLPPLLILLIFILNSVVWLNIAVMQLQKIRKTI